MEIKSKFNVNVKELKKIMVDKDIYKIKDLSRVSGVDRNTLGKILSGEQRPSSTAMYAIVGALNIAPDVAGEIFFSQDLRNT